MLCKNESRDPAHCLKEGRKVTRCATDLWGFFLFVELFSCLYICMYQLIRLTKMREHCLQQFDAHWECLEKRNQVSIYITWESTTGRIAHRSFPNRRDHA